MLSLKLASRNLNRNRWRSALTMGGVAAATAALIWMSSFMDTFLMQLVKGATATTSGQIQLQHEDYVDRPNILDHFTLSPDLLSKLRALDEIKGVAPRLQSAGILGDERRSKGVLIRGIDPTNEPKVTLIYQGLTQGAWLDEVPPPPTQDEMGRYLLELLFFKLNDNLLLTLQVSMEALRGPETFADWSLNRPMHPRDLQQVLLGVGLAKRLDTHVGAHLILFLQDAHQTMRGVPVKVTGILHTGNQLVDQMSVHMRLEDLQREASLDGRFHEVAIGLNDLMSAPEVAKQVRLLVPSLLPEEGSKQEGSKHEPKRLLVRPWQKVQPELFGMLQSSDASMWIMFLMFYIIAALGIFNTQRMSTMERTREFGVLLAIGLSPWQLGATIIIEALILSMLGGLIGVLIGALLVSYHSWIGLDLASFGAFSFMGVAFDQRMFFTLQLKNIFGPLQVLSIVAILCGIIPAWSAARIDAIQAISGRE